MIDYSEAAKLTVHHLAEKLNDEKIVGLTIAGAEQIVMLLCKTFVELGEEENPKIPLPCFMVFPAAFQIALETFYEFCNKHAPADFADDTKAAVEDIVNYSREKGFIKKFMEAGKKEENNEAK